MLSRSKVQTKETMLKLYWRIVFRPYLWLVLLIAALTFLGSTAEVVSIGMLVPLAEMLIEPEQTTANPMTDFLQRSVMLLGISPRLESLVVAGLVLVASMIVVKNGLLLVKLIWVTRLATGVSHLFATRMFEAYLRTHIGEFMLRGRGASHEDVNSVAGAVSRSINLGAQLLYSLIYVVSIFGLLLYLSWWVTLVVGGLVLISMRYMRGALEYRSKWIGQRLHELNQQRTAMQFDGLDGIRVVKAHALEASIVSRLRTIQQRLLPLVVRRAMLISIPNIFFEITGVLLVLLLLVIALNSPDLGLTLPKLLALVVGLRRLTPAAAGVNATLVGLSDALRRIQIADEVLNTLPREPSGIRQMPKQGVSTICLEHVSFHYPERADTRVLHDVNIDFHHGQLAALVGHTGAGKTTIADILARLYEPISGRILVDGVEMREIDLVAWRKNIGYVGQDTFLFNSTLRENIGLWNETVSLEKIEGAARVAQLDEFVQALPERYDTVVGDRGLKLSGGQRQRVAIARAILHRPGVLIFDEATSALDNVTEHAVHMAISQLRTDSVVILVAHRLSTVQDAEQIFVLHEGRVVEKGQHDSLLQARGHYWGLYKGHELEADFATTVDI